MKRRSFFAGLAAGIASLFVPVPEPRLLKQRLISEYIKTAAGRAKLAASMVQPLRRRRDYTALGRKTFLVEQLPDGALPFYDETRG